MVQNQEEISIAQWLKAFPARIDAARCAGLRGSERVWLVERLYRESRRPVLVVVPSAAEAARWIEDLRFFSGGRTAGAYFPAYPVVPFKFMSGRNEIAAQRISVLYRLMSGGVPAMVAPAEALIQKLIPGSELTGYAELVMAGEETDRDALVSKLVSGGYSRTGIVEEPGEFSLRGGILDVFSPQYSNPVRMEFFGDTVDSLRFFAPDTQRKLEDADEAVILPAREAVVSPKHIPRIVDRIRHQAAEQEIPLTRIRDLIDRVKKQDAVPGIEALLPLIYPEPGTLFDYLAENAILVLVEPNALRNSVEKFLDQADKHFLEARTEQRICVAPEKRFLNWPEVLHQAAGKKRLSIQAIAVERMDEPVFQFSVGDNADIRADIKNRREKEHLLLPLVQWIQKQRQAGSAPVVACTSRLQAGRLEDLLSPYGIRMKWADRMPESGFRSDRVQGCLGRLSSGFVWPSEGLSIITEAEIFGPAHRLGKTTRPRVRADVLNLEELQQGDLVVHVDHGIGRYEGLVKLKVEGAENDFLLLNYRDQDRLYLPVERMGLVQKYMGLEGYTPILDKLGGKSWDRMKTRIKKSVELIAADLLKLYADRAIQKGHAFSAADSYFRDFEAGFPYDETEDQLRAIEEVIADMRRAAPMDRLICGDVGYGKTEVALRAAFLAVNDGKQAAVLAPTTVLAEQHFATFSARFEGYPVRVECLSRFRSARQQRAIVEDIKAGKVDIVIGTHRLLQKDVGFKDLGLVVIDEEQRFGVKHKEKLKKMRSSVDVLALSATPIPRTLHMSLTGIRDISLINTPPEQRRPIQTYICEPDDAIIRDAVRREIERKGQIFFVHNQIDSIWSVARRIQDIVPEVRLEVAHGRMSEDELEKAMLRFINREIDLLVCTTIIESGLDIPAANTILINRADRFGLAQIYQLRGRVGRAGEQAYAYLFIPRDTVLTEQAQKRLKVLMEHTDLGAGFQIAMSDLKIRGGGAILGASQSGHIAAVGYDMYLKLMESAVAELKGKAAPEPLEPEINMPISAFIPETYVPDIDQRLSLYRRLSRMTELKEITDLKAELIDRFGNPPEEAGNLFLKFMLKILSVRAGVRRLDLTDSHLVLAFSEAHQKNPVGLVEMVVANRKKFAFTPDQSLRAALEKRTLVGRLLEAKNMLQDVYHRVNAE